MIKLQDYFSLVRENGQAIGHFNFATKGIAEAIVEGSKEAGASTVMLGTSEGEADFFGMGEAVAIVKALAEHFNYPLFLNADHFRSFEKCKQAIDLGYDSVIIDPKNVSYEEKVAITKKVVEYAKNVNQDVTVEGELGYLKGSSRVQTKVEISEDDYTKPEEAKDFVEKTGVNRLAVVFGNFHGIATDQKEHLDIEYFNKIKSFMPDVYYVLHGASGISDEEISHSVRAGITNVHFNTELRVAYRDMLHAAIHENPDETTPYKYISPAVDEIKKIVSYKTKLFLGT